MEKNLVGWFEIPVLDMERAKKFYTTVLEKEFTDMAMPNAQLAMFPFNPEATQASGALVKSEGYEPSANGVVIYLSCEDMANELGRVEAAGGKALMPKTSIGEHGFFAYILDSEGNRVALHSMK